MGKNGEFHKTIKKTYKNSQDSFQTSVALCQGCKKSRQLLGDGYSSVELTTSCAGKPNIAASMQG